jgi:hypothetical protein
MPKKILKRSKSESTHNRRGPTSSTNIKQEHADDMNKSRSIRRRLFSRRANKLKKQITVDNEATYQTIQRQTNETNTDVNKSNLSQQSSRSLPPPPAYESSTNADIVPISNTVTWKGDDQFYSNKATLDLMNVDVENMSGFNDDDIDDDDDEEMSVPLLVTVFVIPLYLTLGAILFNIWENWGFLNSFYFCFITLTTIGFGDFVPGSALNVQAEKEKLISAALYILLGLVLIAMCVNLMKEQLSQKVKRVASKLGNF